MALAGARRLRIASATTSRHTNKVANTNKGSPSEGDRTSFRCPSERRLQSFFTTDAAGTGEEREVPMESPHDRTLSDLLRSNESELKDAIRARDEMMEIVSHDLRNLLNAVSLGAATLGTLDLSQEAFLARTTIDIIARSAQAMKRLIDDLLDLGSIRAGRLSIEAEPQEAAALLGDAVACLEVVAQGKAVTLRAETEGPLPSVCCDRDRVLQVFSNLVSNAVQATSAGGAVVLGARVLDGKVAFSVSDTGGGIPAAELPHIFDRYWRGREGMAYKGAGVGLAIAKALIEAHGGRIWAESAEGLGSSFFFTLPVSGASY